MRDETNLLAEAWEMGVQSTRFILLVLVFQRASFDEGEIQFVLCVYLDQATRLFPFSHVPRTCFAVD
jgi:hypothetical protein